MKYENIYPPFFPFNLSYIFPTFFFKCPLSPNSKRKILPPPIATTVSSSSLMGRIWRAPFPSTLGFWTLENNLPLPLC